MTYVNVDIDVSDIDWCHIVTHVEDCGYFVIDTKTMQDIFEARRYGSQERVIKLVDELVYNTIGRNL